MDGPREITDTIAAVSTPPGKGAISIIRMSGDSALAISSIVFKPDRGEIPGKATRRILVGSLHDPRRDRRIDRAVMLFFPGPGSYTGEDVVEFHCHGGEITPQLVLRALIEAGCRHAERGEFTLRAYLNGRLDLLQAESVIDLVEADSELAQREALYRLEGSLSREIERIREELLELCARVEYAIDFPEEDEPLEGLGGESGRASKLIGRVEHLLDTALNREMVRRGVLTVIAGAPNVGKSSLFNLLLEAERTIVTPHAGTTRDAVEASVDLGEVPLLLVDTAGLHSTQDPIEQKGIEFTRRYIEGANLILFILEANRNPNEEELTFIEEHRNKCLVIINKSDLGIIFDPALLESGASGREAIALSCLERTGMARLKEEVTRAARKVMGTDRKDGPSIAIRARHRVGLERAREAFLRFRDGLVILPPELLSIELREARRALEELTGEVTDDEVLDRIFQEFCIGK